MVRGVLQKLPDTWQMLSVCQADKKLVRRMAQNAMEVYAHGQVAGATRAARRDAKHLCCRFVQHAASTGKPFSNHDIGVSDIESGGDNFLPHDTSDAVNQRYLRAFFHEFSRFFLCL